MTDYLFGGPNVRHLSYTKVLPYSPTLIFNVFSDIASYHEFSTSIDSSKVTNKDASGLPTAATLNVGYSPLGLTEEWRCIAICDRKAGTVEVRNAPVRPGEGGVLEVWKLKWTISPAPSGEAEKKQATVKLEMELKFNNVVVDGTFAVLPAVAEKTMLKFERRVGEVEERKRKVEAKQKATVKKTEPAEKVVEKKAKNANGRPRKLEVRSMSERSDVSVD